MTNIIHIGTRQVEPSQREELLALFRRAIETFRGLPGIDKFVVAEDVADPNKFYVIEEWGDEDGINQQLTSDAAKEIGAELRRLVSEKSSEFWSAEQVEVRPDQRIREVRDGSLILDPPN